MIKLIHEAEPLFLPVVIAILARVVCTSVCPSVLIFPNRAKQNKVQVRIVIATGGTAGLAEWIINDTHVL